MLMFCADEKTNYMKRLRIEVFRYKVERFMRIMSFQRNNKRGIKDVRNVLVRSWEDALEALWRACAPRDEIKSNETRCCLLRGAREAWKRGNQAESSIQPGRESKISTENTEARVGEILALHDVLFRIAPLISTLARGGKSGNRKNDSTCRDTTTASKSNTFFLHFDRVFKYKYFGYTRAY